METLKGFVWNGDLEGFDWCHVECIYGCIGNFVFGFIKQRFLEQKFLESAGVSMVD